MVVDGDSAIGENLGEILEMEGYECRFARSADAALRRLKFEVRSPNVILLDFNMPGMSMRRFISHLKDPATWATAPIILMTGAPDVTIPADLLVDARLPKLFSIERLLELVRGLGQQTARAGMPTTGE